jgi:hypothetical protein
MDEGRDTTDRLAEAVAALKYLSRIRHELPRGTREYDVAIERETEQIETVRGLIRPDVPMKSQHSGDRA